MAAKVFTNGNARWATFILALLIAIVAGIFYVADVEASAERNRRDIDRMLQTDERSVKLLRSIQDRQFFLMQHLGIKKEDIPD